jgi:acyl phosphate:glycerol-3-phosphate acyltransferase
VTAGTDVARDVALGVGSYLLGGIPVAWLLARHAGIDLRAAGSRRIGTSNLFRTVGLRSAMVAGPAQFAQGLVPSGAAHALGLPLHAQAVAVLAAVGGNMWPVYLRCRGGNGVAVATGAVAGVTAVGLGVLLTTYTAGALCHRSAPSVLVGFAALPPIAALTVGRGQAVAFAALLALIVVRRGGGARGDVAQGARVGTAVIHRLVFDGPPTTARLDRRPTSGSL